MPARLLAHELGSSARCREDDPQPSADGGLDALPEILTLDQAAHRPRFLQYKTATVLRRIARRQQLHELPEHRGVLAVPAGSPGGGAGAPARAADQRHALLPRSRRVRRARAARSSRGCSTTSTRRTRCASGWPAVQPGRRRTRSPCCWPRRRARARTRRRSRCSRPTSTSRRLPMRARGATREADVADVSPERLRRFFIRETSRYRVRRDLRETVLFAHHNVLKDPPFSHLDLVCCRNLLIYLNRHAQARADPDVPVRPAPWRLSLPGQLGVAGRDGRPVRDDRQGRAHLRGANRRRALLPLAPQVFTPRAAACAAAA